MSASKNQFAKPELSVEELSHALYETTIKLQATNEQLIKQEQQNKEFYANISHDLRAPVTAINNSIEYLLSDTSIPKDEYINTLQIMQKRTIYLSKLINDVFLLSSLESSSNDPAHSKLHKELVDIGFFLEDYFYMCEADKKFENANLALAIPEDFSLTMEIDPKLMQRVLDNLFTNSLKYSKNTPFITLGAYISDSMLHIYIEDQGIGIAKKHLNKIFERSYMVQRARTPDHQNSSGFGLAIVKAIIEQHGGTIHCESELKKGSKFTISLPISSF